VALIDLVKEALEGYICGRDVIPKSGGAPRRWQGIRGRIPSRIGEPEPQLADGTVVRGAIIDGQLPQRWIFNSKQSPTQLQQNGGTVPVTDALSGIVYFDETDPIADGDLIIDMCAIEGATIEQEGDEISIALVWASSYPNWVYDQLKAPGRVRPYIHDGRPNLAAAEIIEHLQNVIGWDDFSTTAISHRVEMVTYESLSTLGFVEGGPRVLSSGGGGAAAVAPTDVMIVPVRRSNPRTEEEKNQKAYEQFGLDWVAAGPNRRLIHMKSDVGLTEAEAALMQAAKDADGGGSIYLNVGHGGVGNAIPTTGSGRHQDISGFDLVPWSTAANRLMANTADLIVSESHGGIKMTDSALFAVKEMFTRVGAAFREHKVRLFSAIACNGGKDPRFGQAVGKLLGVRVDLYEWLIYVGEDQQGHPLIWYNNATAPSGTTRGQIPDADKHFLMTREAAYGYAAEHGYQY
jgi:hypothetical protein